MSRTTDKKSIPTTHSVASPGRAFWNPHTSQYILLADIWVLEVLEIFPLLSPVWTTSQSNDFHQAPFRSLCGTLKSSQNRGCFSTGWLLFFENMKDEGKQTMGVEIFALSDAVSLSLHDWGEHWLALHISSVLIPSWCRQEAKKQGGGQIGTAWRQSEDNPASASRHCSDLFHGCLLGGSRGGVVEQYDITSSLVILPLQLASSSLASRNATTLPGRRVVITVGLAGAGLRCSADVSGSDCVILMLLFLFPPQLLLPAASSASCLPSSSSSSWSTAWGRRTRAATTSERGNPPVQPIKRPQPRSFTRKPPSYHQNNTRQVSVEDSGPRLQHTHNETSWIWKTSIKESFCIEYCN